MIGRTVWKNTFSVLVTLCILIVLTVLFQSTRSLPKLVPIIDWQDVKHNDPKNILELRGSKVDRDCSNFSQVAKLSQLSHWEVLTLNDPKVTDFRSLASSKRSHIMIVNRKDSYFVGDEVDVLVTVRDGNGRRKTRGGDEVRIWSRGPGYTGSLGAVTDLGDGTYLGRVKIFWAGNITIKAGVFTSREGIAILFRAVKKHSTQYAFFGQFGNGSNHETVACTASEETALRFTGICDMTEKNHGLPWYCARPEHASCSRWIMHIQNRNNLINSDVESQMIKAMMIRSSMNMSIKIVSRKRWNPKRWLFKTRNYNSTPIPCNQVPPNLTWHVRTPVGYAYNGIWFSTFCSSDYSLSIKKTSPCLAGRRLWLLGDSTTRQLYSYLMKALQLYQITAEWTNPKSYNFSLAVDIKRTFGIAYSVHGLPFGYGGRHVRPNSLVATHAYINSIAAGSKDIVLVHFYTHFQTMHPNVMRHSLRKTVESIKRLHQRAPEVLFLVKGPHAFHYRNMSIHVNDFWGNVVVDIFREEFVSVQDYVVYLDMWDLSASIENIDIHPYQPVIRMIVNYVLSFICPSNTPNM